MTLKRVLFVIHFPVFGGPHNQALRLAEPLRAHGWDTVVVLPAEPGNAAERLREAGIEVVTMPLHRLRASTDPRLLAGLLAGVAPEIRALRQVIRQHSIDLVQVGGLVNPHAAIAARLEHVPVVWQLLDTRAPLPLAVVSMALVRSLADVVMSTGRSVALSHPGGSGIADRTVPFFPPVDIDVFRPRTEERQRVRSEWGIPQESPVVGCVANINPQKGIVALVEAFALVRRRVPAARLVLVGAEYRTQTAYSAGVRAAMVDAGLVAGRDVIFVGERTDVERQLAGMDVFAFAPVRRGEGISTVVLEAMASGLPVVVTAVAGIPEAIESGVSGFLVPPDDSRSMAGAICDLLMTPETAVRVGEAARRRAVDRFGIASCVDDHLRAYELALIRRGKWPGALPERGVRPRPVLVCPSCRATLAAGRSKMVCGSCGRTYPVVDGIPVLLLDVDLSGHDDLGHHSGGDGRTDAHKSAQASHFDRAVAEEFETSRPHGTPTFYRFLLVEKFRRASAPIRPGLAGALALAVCGGSGMDAEFLARAGASVVSTDISLGAARRTRERARRHGLDITSVVADVEHLPFADASFELVYVHDGLHHLERPDVGLQEMARVARRWVSVTEPARALATSAAVRVGIASEREEAGNNVVRLDPGDVVGALRTVGFRPLSAGRYAMYYRHEPGSVFRLLSRRSILPFARLGWRLGNVALGRAGNKMVVIAERNEFTTNRTSRSRSRVDEASDRVKRLGRQHLPFLHPAWMLLKRAAFRVRYRSTEARFNEIFRGNHWRNSESVSGFGSSFEATADARTAVAEIVQQYSVTSLLDVPCGDFNWMKHVEFDGFYCGADIVRELITENQARYGSDRRRFAVLDVTRDQLPASDLVLCRDCLNHLSIAEAARALANIVASGSSYMALTHYPTTNVNRPQETGFIYRPLNLQRPPFNLPPPVGVWEESAEPGKTMALWRIDLLGKS